MNVNNTQVLEKVNTGVVCTSNTFVLEFDIMNLTYGERLKAARKYKKLSQPRLAEISGVGQGTISKIERGDQDASAHDVNLSFALEVHPMWLTNGDKRFAPEWLDGDSISIESSRLTTNTEPAAIVGKVPLISWVQAGTWSEIIDNYHPGDADKWVETTAKITQGMFALRVVGDSMINPDGFPSLPPGVTVIVDPNKHPEHNDIVIARLDDSMEATIKQLKIDGNQRILKALNPDYQPIKINGNCTICGVAVKVEFDL